MSAPVLLLFSLSKLNYLVQSKRRGKITWGTISSDPESLIDPRFLLDAKLGNPTRMTLTNITSYWNHWVSKQKKGDPFFFLSVDDDSDRSGIGGISDKEDEDIPEDLPIPSPDYHNIDEHVLYPFKCTPSKYTSCLQKLVPKGGETNNTFHELVKIVDDLEVSSRLNI